MIRFIPIFIALFFGIQQLIELNTRGFCLQKIFANDLPHNPEWESPTNADEKIRAILCQPFTFLGAGSECFAFLSEDGKSVIKFFKLDHTRPVYLLRGVFREDHSRCAGTLSDHPMTKINVKPLKRMLGIREYRIKRTFSSIKLAYDELKEETGLLFIHLNPSAEFNKTLTIIDACGIRHEVDLNQTRFFLQQRAVPLEHHFNMLKEKKAIDMAKLSIDSLLLQIAGRCKKGFADRDILNRNFGYIETNAIEIDSGSYLVNSKMKEPLLCKQEIFFGTLELKKWLKKNYPELLPHLEQRLESALEA